MPKWIVPTASALWAAVAIFMMAAPAFAQGEPKAQPEPEYVVVKTDALKQLIAEYLRLRADAEQRKARARECSI